MANKDKSRWYDGWTGFIPQHTDEDYHVDGQNHLPLEKLGQIVADQQKRPDRHSRT